MAKRQFLMLAHDYDPKRHSILGWYMSEKLDGLRAWWDGGITTGLKCSEVPFANTEKHSRFVTEPIATGLWSRYGQPIRAPEWWTQKLPKMSLDGELVEEGFQQTSSVVRSSVNVKDWSKVKFACFDSPDHTVVLREGRINIANMKKTIPDCIKFVSDRAVETGALLWCRDIPFYEVYDWLKREIKEGPAYPHLQVQLPSTKVACEELLNRAFEEIKETGGEGIMLRSPISLWNPIRSYDLLKHKVERDMEGTVIGYKWGSETDVEKSISGEVTDRLVGSMGSIKLKLDSGVIFNLASGFTLAEREMSYGSIPSIPSNASIVFESGRCHQGQEVSSDFVNPKFPIGSQITFKYRELTDDGLPKEARYWRPRND